MGYTNQGTYVATPENPPSTFHPGPHFTKALKNKGMYVSPELRMAVIDSMQAIAAEQGSIDSYRLNNLQCIFSHDHPNGTTPEFKAWLIGYINLLGCETFAADVKAYIQEHHLENVVTFKTGDKPSDVSTELVSTDLDAMIAAIVEGFVNKRGPEYAIDYKSYLNHADTQRVAEKDAGAGSTWAGRAKSGNDGQGHSK